MGDMASEQTGGADLRRRWARSSGSSVLTPPAGLPVFPDLESAAPSAPTSSVAAGRCRDRGRPVPLRARPGVARALPAGLGLRHLRRRGVLRLPAGGRRFGPADVAPVRPHDLSAGGRGPRPPGPAPGRRRAPRPRRCRSRRWCRSGSGCPARSGSRPSRARRRARPAPTSTPARPSPPAEAHQQQRRHDGQRGQRCGVPARVGEGPAQGAVEERLEHGGRHPGQPGPEHREHGQPAPGQRRARAPRAGRPARSPTAGCPGSG